MMVFQIYLQYDNGEPFKQILLHKEIFPLFVDVMLSVPITINVVSSNPTRGRCTRYNIMR
jgi:hypothetical protein